MGVSKRTNELGAQQVARAFPDYPCLLIRVESGLHLKTLVTLAGPRTLVAGDSPAARKIVQVQHAALPMIPLEKSTQVFPFNSDRIWEAKNMKMSQTDRLKIFQWKCFQCADRLFFLEMAKLEERLKVCKQIWKVVYRILAPGACWVPAMYVCWCCCRKSRMRRSIATKSSPFPMIWPTVSTLMARWSTQLAILMLPE